MIATILSILFAGTLFVVEGVFPGIFGQLLFPETMFQLIFIIFLLLSLSPFVHLSFFLAKSCKCPIVKSSIRSCLCDKKLYLLSTAVFVSAIAGLLISAQEFLNVPYTFALAVIAVGLGVDLVRLSFLRMYRCASQDGIADWMLSKIRKAMYSEDEKSIFESFELIFAVFVSYIKYGDSGSLRLFSLRAVGLIEELLRTVSTTPFCRQTQENSLLDRYSTVEAMTTKRLAWALDVAEENGSPSAIEETMRLYGKLFMVFHNHHESLGFVLLVSLSHDVLSKGAPGNYEKDAEFMMICSEVVKSLIDRSYERRVSEKATMSKILTILETHVKTCFRRDRSINPAFLMQPFAEIGQLLGDPLYAALPDREDILAELKRILAQFSALEMVSTHLDIGEHGTDTRSSYKEDLPFKDKRTILVTV